MSLQIEVLLISCDKQEKSFQMAQKALFYISDNPFHIHIMKAANTKHTKKQRGHSAEFNDAF